MLNNLFDIGVEAACKAHENGMLERAEPGYELPAVSDNATAARFGKKVAETTVGTICEAFRKKGIHPGTGNTALKP